jgi:hypothetical protein
MYFSSKLKLEVQNEDFKIYSHKYQNFDQRVYKPESLLSLFIMSTVW